MRMLSRICNIPSPSQRPKVPPRDARNDDKLKDGKSLMVISTLSQKAMSTLDTFLLKAVWNSFMNTVLIRVSVQGTGHPEKRMIAMMGFLERDHET